MSESRLAARLRASGSSLRRPARSTSRPAPGPSGAPAETTGPEPAATESRLTPAMLSLVGRAEIGVVATADAHGECDSSLRTGPPGFVRVLDATHLAYPEYRGNGVMASLGNITENPQVGLVLIDFARGRTKLHLSGGASIVSDADLRTTHPDLPVETVPGRRTDVWVVLEIESASLEGGEGIPALVPVARAKDWGTDDTARKGGDYFGAAAERKPERTPRVPAARAGAPAAARFEETSSAPRDPSQLPSQHTVEPTAGGTGDETTEDTVADVAQDTGPPAGRPAGAAAVPPERPERRRGPLARRLPLVAAALAVLVVLLAAALVVSLVAGGGSSQAGPAGADPAAGTAADPANPAGGPDGPATLYGRVVTVNDPSTITVDVAGQQVPVDVLGIDASGIPPCARAGALAFARTTLDRQMVTLVPDPTVAPQVPRQAYVVTDRQFSYTDAIIQAGWAAPSGTALYRPVFDEERRTAETDGVGMYGRACGR